jgi:hypothetical protein
MERSLGHRAPLLWLLLPFMGGLAAGRDWTPPVALLSALLAVSLAIGILGARSPTRLGFALWAAGLFSAVAAAGVAWIGLHNSWIPEWKHLPARERFRSLRAACRCLALHTWLRAEGLQLRLPGGVSISPRSPRRTRQCGAAQRCG